VKIYHKIIRAEIELNLKAKSLGHKKTKNLKEVLTFASINIDHSNNLFKYVDSNKYLLYLFKRNSLRQLVKKLERNIFMWIDDKDIRLDQDYIDSSTFKIIDSFNASFHLTIGEQKKIIKKIRSLYLAIGIFGSIIYLGKAINLSHFSLIENYFYADDTLRHISLNMLNALKCFGVSLVSYVLSQILSMTSMSNKVIYSFSSEIYNAINRENEMKTLYQIEGSSVFKREKNLM